MISLSNSSVRATLLLVLAAFCLLLDVNTAYAQAAQCRQLENALRQFDRNGDFQQMGGNSQAARQAQLVRQFKLAGGALHAAQRSPRTAAHPGMAPAQAALPGHKQQLLEQA